MYKTILCYGDSNTWGFVPGKADYATMYRERYSKDQRWPGLLQKLLNENYYIIEEGLNGRTINLDYKIPPDRNGKTYLPPCLYSHAPIDLVIIALGGNDLKTYFNRSAKQVCAGMTELIEIIQTSKYGPGMQKAPDVLIISLPLPLAISETAKDGEGNLIYTGAIERAKELVDLYADLAKQKNCYFLDVTKDVKPSAIDGVHLDESGHAMLAKMISQKVKSIYAE